MHQDDEHLRLLAIFHGVVAAVAALVALFPVFHLVLGVMMVTGRLSQADKQPPVALFGWFFIVFALLWIAGALAFAVCMALAGRYLSQRRHYTYCLVMAGLACMFVPFGTVLGVMTLLVLTREPVRTKFIDTPAPTPS